MSIRAIPKDKYKGFGPWWCQLYFYWFEGYSVAISIWYFTVDAYWKYSAIGGAIHWRPQWFRKRKKKCQF